MAHSAQLLAAARAKQAASRTRSEPFDSQYESEFNSLQSQLAQLTADTGIATNRTNQDFLINKNRLTDQRGDILKSLEQKFADNGILRSGINIAKQAKVGQDYTQDVGDLTQGLARRTEDINRDQTAGTNTILSAQRAAKAASTRRGTDAALAAAEASARRKANENLTKQLASQAKRQRSSSYRNTPAWNTQALANIARFSGRR